MTDYSPLQTSASPRCPPDQVLEMVERVARALCRADARDPDEPYVTGPATDELGPAWKWFAGDARAAIDAMREPTEQQLLVGWKAARKSPVFEVRAIYADMIDAALSTPHGV